MSDNQSKPIKGWVKEADRLPEKDGVYCIKRIDLLNDVAIYSTDTESFYYPLNPTSLYRKSIDSWLDETPIAEGEERWISVEDRLPNLNIEYNVAWDVDDRPDDLVVTTMEFRVEDKKWIDVINMGIDVTELVRFWRELPEPPKPKL